MSRHLRDVDAAKFQERIIEGLKETEASKAEAKESKDGGEAKKSKTKRKKKKELERYGVQLVDVPGELEDEVLPNTAEYEEIRQDPELPPPPKNEYKDLQAEANDEDDADEVATLVQQGDSRKHGHQARNRLFEAATIHGFIVVFDFGNQQSLQKSKNICDEIRRIVPEPQESPIVLLSNKTDRMVSTVSQSETEVRDEMRKYADSHEHMYFASGSVLRNELEWDDERMAVDMWIHNFVKKLHELGLGDSGEEKKKRRGGRSDGPDDEESSAGWCNCCAQAQGDEDGERPGEEGGGCLVM